MMPSPVSLTALDRTIHEPGRLVIVAHLAATERCDFLSLLNQTGLSKGNLSSHLSKLEEAGYVTQTKTFRGKVPQTLIDLTYAGRKAYSEYRRAMLALLAERKF